MPEFIKMLKWRIYHSWLSLLVWRIRRKKTIKFGYLVQELTQWKTELLYIRMLEHPRFDPILCVSPSLGYPGAEKELMQYCDSKGYEYIWLDPQKTIGEQLKVDLVVHEKPYPTEIHFAHQIDNNRNIPVVFIPYYLSTITEQWVVNKRLNLMCWRQFVDNESCRESWKRIHKLKGLTYKVTGLPVMDELLTPKEKLKDVWPNKDGRKRIIYAPHHTIADMHVKGIGYSTFLDYYDFMLEIRDKYKEKAYFVFKPHPSLWNKLSEYWGKEKTEAYYRSWKQYGNSHVETGEYLSLFKYSDAMIHDCGSFTIEYLYMDNPVMYLVRDEKHTDNMIPYARDAFDLHYKGKNREDIENFVLDVINEKDPLKGERDRFKKQFLLPPNGKSACENIVDSILGK